MIERRITRLNEEISRWAFEIKIETSKDWKIIFTNPTAGPWKKIMCTDENNNVGEVYRFQLEEERPDIIMINDDLKMILIIEAKDSIEKLTQGTQANKTVEVTENMAKMLMENGHNRFWNERSQYKTYLGLLWGNDGLDGSSKIESLFKNHYSLLVKNPHIEKELIIGIETIFDASSNSIKCVPHYFYKEKTEFINSVMTSLASIDGL